MNIQFVAHRLKKEKHTNTIGPLISENSVNSITAVVVFVSFGGDGGGGVGGAAKEKKTFRSKFVVRFDWRISKK